MSQYSDNDNTHYHAGETLLFLQHIVDVRRNERIELVEVLLTLLALAPCLRFWLFRCELFQKLDRRIDQRRCFGALLLRAHDRPPEMLAEFSEQVVERLAIHECLQDRVGEAHVASVDEPTRTDLR